MTTPKKGRVFAVDDEPYILEAWSEILADDYEVQCFADPFAAKAELEKGANADVVLLDLRMPGMDGLTLLQIIKQLERAPEVIIVTGEGTVKSAVEGMRAGAYDFLCKPITDYDEALLRIDGAIERRRLRTMNARLSARLEAFRPTTEIVGESAAIEAVRTFIAKVAESTAPVLITGESGTGKELVARAIFRMSGRAERPYVVTNCGAIASSLIDSELFGHERGAFTGATAARRGLFEAANQGTLFLDELGDVPLDTQVRLLRTLQEGEVRPVGATEPRNVDVRVLAATNVDIDHAIKAGTFREDLYYRLSTFRITLPPLRDRKEDVPLIGQYLLNKLTDRMDRPKMRFSDEALARMLAYQWPGNVRELGNAVEHGATLAKDHVIDAHDLPAAVTTSGVRRATSAAKDTARSASSVSYKKARDQVLTEFEFRYLSDVLDIVDGNLSEASRRSGIDRSNLRRMLKKHSLHNT